MKRMTVWGAVAAAAALILAACATPTSPPQLTPVAASPGPGPEHDALVAAARKDWVAGGAAMMPQDLLDLFPCHEEELPCGKLAPQPVQRVSFRGPLRGDPKKGEAIATNVRYGNCIACHSLPNGHDGGNIGPSLRDVVQRNLPLDYIFQRIWDVRAYSPNAFMPVYGPNKVLNEQEIHDVMAFILGVKGG